MEKCIRVHDGGTMMRTDDDSVEVFGMTTKVIFCFARLFRCSLWLVMCGNILDRQRRILTCLLRVV